ncbi:MAG: hypothetical protein V4773_25830 [Verrucomicrobiota bacterium]
MSLLRALLEAITAVANAYAAKLRQDAPLAHYRAQLEIAHDIEQLEDEVARLRADDSPGGHARADILRQRLLARQGIAAGISAARAASGNGKAGTDA